MRTKKIPKPTIKDIADRAGVSSTTVSLVLHDRVGVGQDTREAIFKIAGDLGYQLRRRSRSTAEARPQSGQQRNIALLVDDKYFFSGEMFYSRILSSIVRELEAEGYHAPIITISEGRLRDLELPEILGRNDLAGIVIAGDLPVAYLQRIQQLDRPVVMLGFEIPQFPWLFVENDNLRGAQIAVEHLIELGHRRILCLASDGSLSSIRERIDGYTLALAKHRIPIEAGLQVLGEGQPGIDEGQALMQSVIKSGKKFTAIFAANDALAIGAIKALQEANIGVPEQVSVIGFDNVEWGSHFNPPLSTINVHRKDLGRAAVFSLLSLMSNRHAKPPQLSRVTIPVELVVRRSTASPK